MIRRAFRMSVDPGRQDEYVRRHQPIWRDLEEILLAHGIHSYSIYLDPGTNDLFAYVEFESEELWAAVAATEVCQRWWKHMSDVMPVNADHSPRSRPLTEVFHIQKS